MPDLLLELRSEEIPARMQRKAAGDLRKMVTEGLVEAGLTYEAAREYWTPRRLTLDLRGLTARSKDVREERKGPSTKAPEQAIQGFLRAAGLSSVDEAHVHSDPKKGDFYVAHIVRPGQAADEIIAELIPAVIRSFPWPKSMRWGPASAKPGSLRWVRPLQSIVCTFGPETEEPVVVDFEVDGIRSGNVTYGHRFHAPDAITVRRFDDYSVKLEAAKVIIDADRRREIILTDAKNIAFANRLELVEDEGLLEEVSGLVEWPVVLMGEFETDFLAIPAEIIRLTIRANQKCFVTRPSRLAPLAPQDEDSGGFSTLGNGETQPVTSPKSGRSTNLPHPEVRAERASKDALSNRFILTANIEASDGGSEIAHGNGKVVRARLSDALYFWQTDQSDLPDLDQLKESAEKFGLDLAKPLDQRMARLDHLGVTFHAKLGTQGERVERIRRLAREIAPIVGANPELADRAAVLAKADLTTEIVGEFPELQGAMGRKYALLQGEDASVAAAIEEHYKPQGPSDRVPTDPVSIAVALADKLDTLVGFWAIDEKPTGSKDPYALRRAALGVVRLVLGSELKLKILPLIRGCIDDLLIPSSSIFAEIVDATVKADDVFSENVEYRLLNMSSAETKRYMLFAKNILIGMEEPSDYEAPSGDAGEPIWLDMLRRYFEALVPEFLEHRFDPSNPSYAADRHLYAKEYMQPLFNDLADDLLAFFHDRLKVYLRDQGARHDLIDAVLAGGGLSPLEGEMSPKATEGVGQGNAGRKGASNTTETTPPRSASRIDPPLKGEGGVALNDDLLQIVRRVEALGKFLATDDGKNLLAGTKRAANILAAEEKKKTLVADSVDLALFREDAEKALFEAVNQAESQAAQAIKNEDFSAALAALSVLREPVDAFFERVLVNDEDANVRAYRLALLSRIRAATDQVADFSKIAG